MSLIFPTRARNALCTEEWCCALASGIDMKSSQPQSRKMENMGVGVNELLMPCSAHYMAYVSCWWPAVTIPVSCCNMLPKTPVHCSCSFFLSFFFFTQYQMLPFFRDHIIPTFSCKVTVVFQILDITLNYITKAMTFPALNYFNSIFQSVNH